MRYSCQRKLIEDILKGRKDHPTADAVYLSAREIMPNISLGTVYRNLKYLADERVIDTLETVDKRIHYDGDRTRHAHFICKKCGKIIDLFEPQELPDEIKKLGLTVSEEKCVYYGECAECKDKADNTSN